MMSARTSAIIFFSGLHHIMTGNSIVNKLYTVESLYVDHLSDCLKVDLLVNWSLY